MVLIDDFQSELSSIENIVIISIPLPKNYKDN